MVKNLFIAYFLQRQQKELKVPQINIRHAHIRHIEMRHGLRNRWWWLNSIVRVNILSPRRSDLRRNDNYFISIESSGAPPWTEVMVGVHA